MCHLFEIYLLERIVYEGDYKSSGRNTKSTLAG